MTIEKRRVCMIHAYPSPYVVGRLSDAGYNVIVVGPPATDAMALGPGLERFVPATLHDEDAVVSMLEDLHRDHPIDVVLPINEGTTALTSAVAERLGLRGNPVSASNSSRNKYEAFLRWSSNGVRVPKTIPIHDLEKGWKDVEDELGYPAILKLADSMNSQGVTLLRRRDDFGKFAARLRELLGRPVGYDMRDDRNRIAYGRGDVSVIAQSFCPGAEVGVDLLYRDGAFAVLGIFEKAPLHGPCFGETMSVTPTSLGAEADREIGELAAKAVFALGGKAGAAHVEIRYGDNGPHVIEAGLRPGGGFTMQALEILHGFCPAVELARLLEGGDLPEVKELKRAALYGGVLYATSGTLRRIEGLEVFKDLPGLVYHGTLHKEGDRVFALPESSQPHFVYYLLADDSRAEVVASHQRIHEAIKLKIDPFDAASGARAAGPPAS